MRNILHNLNPDFEYSFTVQTDGDYLERLKADVESNGGRVLECDRNQMVFTQKLSRIIGSAPFGFALTSLGAVKVSARVVNEENCSIRFENTDFKRAYYTIGALIVLISGYLSWVTNEPATLLKTMFIYYFLGLIFTFSPITWVYIRVKKYFNRFAAPK